ncbi:hypothetical protein IAT40_006166 [Kwoniella sp. CBS 6097]
MKRPSSTEGEGRPSPPAPQLSTPLLTSGPMDKTPSSSTATADNHDQYQDQHQDQVQTSRQQQLQLQPDNRLQSTNSSMGLPILVTPHLNEHDRPTFAQQDVIKLGPDDPPANGELDIDNVENKQAIDIDIGLGIDDDFVMVDRGSKPPIVDSKELKPETPRAPTGEVADAEERPLVINLGVPQQPSTNIQQPPSGNHVVQGSAPAPASAPDPKAITDEPYKVVGPSSIVPGHNEKESNVENIELLAREEPLETNKHQQKPSEAVIAEPSAPVDGAAPPIPLDDQLHGLVKSSLAENSPKEGQPSEQVALQHEDTDVPMDITSTTQEEASATIEKKTDVGVSVEMKTASDLSGATGLVEDVTSVEEHLSKMNETQRIKWLEEAKQKIFDHSSVLDEVVFESLRGETILEHRRPAAVSKSHNIHRGAGADDRADQMTSTVKTDPSVEQIKPTALLPITSATEEVSPPEPKSGSDSVETKDAVSDRQLTEAEKRGLTEDEYQADLLASGELDIKDLTDDKRKKLFRILWGKGLGKARSLVAPTSWPRRANAPDAYDTGSVRAPLKWSRPTLQLSFTRKAATDSQGTVRQFKFEADESFVCVPSNNTTPHITSLLLAQPFLTACKTLNVELLEREGSGSLSDGYRGILRSTLGGESRRVVVKVTSPSAFQDGHERFNYNKAKTRVKKEATRYTTHLAALQGEVVPIFYGLWKMDRPLSRRYGLLGKTRPYKVYVAVLEDVGPAINKALGLSGENLRSIDISYKRQILDLYHKLKSQGVSHEGYKTVHIRYKGENDLRLIDFEKAELSYSGHYEAMDVCECLGVGNDETARQSRISEGALNVQRSTDRYWWYNTSTFPDVNKRDEEQEEQQDEEYSDKVSTTAVAGEGDRNQESGRALGDIITRRHSRRLLGRESFLE